MDLEHAATDTAGLKELIHVETKKGFSSMQTQINRLTEKKQPYGSKKLAQGSRRKTERLPAKQTRHPTRKKPKSRCRQQRFQQKQWKQRKQTESDEQIEHEKEKEKVDELVTKSVAGLYDFVADFRKSRHHNLCILLLSSPSNLLSSQPHNLTFHQPLYPPPTTNHPRNFEPFLALA
jgi:hypothetical protein